MYEFELFFPATDEHKIAYARRATDLPSRTGYNPNEYVIVGKWFID